MVRNQIRFYLRLFVLWNVVVSTTCLTYNVNNYVSTDLLSVKSGCAEYEKINGVCFGPSYKISDDICEWKNTSMNPYYNLYAVSFNYILSAYDCLNKCVRYGRSVPQYNFRMKECKCFKQIWPLEDSDPTTTMCIIAKIYWLHQYKYYRRYLCGSTEFCFSTSKWFLKGDSAEKNIHFVYFKTFFDHNIVLIEAYIKFRFTSNIGNYTFWICRVPYQSERKHIVGLSAPLRNLIFHPCVLWRVPERKKRNDVYTPDVSRLMQYEFESGNYKDFSLAILLHTDNVAIPIKSVMIASEDLLVSYSLSSKDSDKYLFYERDEDHVSTTFQTGLHHSKHPQVWHFELSYFLFGSEVGLLIVWINFSRGNSKAEKLFIMNGYNHNQWRKKETLISTDQDFQIEFIAANNIGYDSQMALGDVTIKTSDILYEKCNSNQKGKSGFLSNPDKTSKPFKCNYIINSPGYTLRVDIIYNLQNNRNILTVVENGVATLLTGSGFTTYKSSISTISISLHCDVFPELIVFSANWVSIEDGHFEEQRLMNLPVPTLLFPLASQRNYIDMFDYGSHALNFISDLPVSMQTVANKYGFPHTAIKFDTQITIPNLMEVKSELNDSFTVLFQFKHTNAHVHGNLVNFGDCALTISDCITVHLSSPYTFETKVRSNGVEHHIFKENISENWHFIAIVFKDRTLSVYMDLKLLGLIETSDNFSPFNGTLQVGRSDQYLSCLQVYNSTLTLRVIKSLELCPNQQDRRFHYTVCTNGGINVIHQRNCNCRENQTDFVGEEDCQNELTDWYSSAHIYTSFDNIKTGVDVNGLPIPLSAQHYVPIKGVINTAACYKEMNLVEMHTQCSSCPQHFSIQFWVRLEIINDNDSWKEILLIHDIEFYVYFKLEENTTVLNAIARHRSSSLRCHFHISTNSWFHIDVRFTGDLNVSIFGEKIHHKRCIETSDLPPIDESPVFNGKYELCLDEISLSADKLASNHFHGIKNGFLHHNQRIHGNLVKMLIIVATDVFRNDYHVHLTKRLSYVFIEIQSKICSWLDHGKLCNGQCKLVRAATGSDGEIPWKHKQTFIFQISLHHFDDKLRKRFESLYHHEPQHFDQFLVRPYRYGCLRISCSPPNFTATFHNNTLIINVTSIFEEEQMRYGFGYMVQLKACSIIDLRSCNSIQKTIYTGEKLFYWKDFAHFKRIELVSLALMTIWGNSPYSSVDVDYTSFTKRANTVALTSLNSQMINSTCVQLSYSIRSYKWANNWYSNQINFFVNCRRLREDIYPSTVYNFSDSFLTMTSVSQLEDTVDQIICGLQPYTYYVTSVNTINEKGDGKPSNLHEFRMPVDVPKVAPSYTFTLQSFSALLVYVYSNDTEIMCSDNLTSIEVMLVYEKKKEISNYTFSSLQLGVKIVPLNAFSLYKVRTRVYNFIGHGPASTMCFVTQMSPAPLSPPSMSISFLNATAVNVLMNPIPRDKEGCIIDTFRLIYGKYSTNERYIINSSMNHSLLDFNTWHEFSNSEVNCSVTRPNFSESTDVWVLDLRPDTLYSLNSSACCFGRCSELETLVVHTKPYYPQGIQHVEISNKTSTAFFVTWNQLDQSDWNGPNRTFNVVLYYNGSVFNASEELVHSFSLPSHNNTLQFNHLRKYSLYVLTIQTANSFGLGKALTVTISTEQDVPDGPPQNVTVTPINSTALEFIITAPDIRLHNGIIIGYEIVLSSCKENLSFVSNKDELVTRKLISNLAKNTMFTVLIRAFSKVGSGPEHNITGKTLEDSPDGPPLNLSASSVSNDSAVLYWNEISGELQNGLIISYNVTLSSYYNNGSLSLQTFDLIPVGTGSFSLSMLGLLPYTRNNVDVIGCTVIGCSENASFTFTTNEMIPNSAVSNFSYCNQKILFERICVRWNDLPTMERRGNITAFVGTYIPVNSNGPRSSFDVGGNVFNITLPGLLNHTSYLIEVAAVTKIGAGPLNEKIFITRENVPSVAPSDLIAFNTSSSSLHVKFNEIPDVLWEGNPMGYKLEYRRTEVACVNGNVCSPWNAIVLNGTENTSCNLTNLGLHTNYSVRVSGLTGAGVGVQSPIIFVETDTFVDGGWNEWSLWGYCDRSCGGGKINRYRHCIDPEPARGGAPCNGSKHEFITCNQFPCQAYYLIEPAKDCKESCDDIDPEFQCLDTLFTKDSVEVFRNALDLLNGSNPANVACSRRLMSAYSLSKHPLYIHNLDECVGFTDVPVKVKCESEEIIGSDERRLCFCGKPDAKFYGEWSSWSHCSKSCGVGIKVRRRNCHNTGTCELTEQNADCNIHLCPVHGEWGNWSEWSLCSVTCGYGVKRQYRSCSNPTPKHGGDDCVGHNVNAIPGCNPNECPIDGGWTEWDTNVYCSQACGENGVKRYTRKCTRPAPQFGGNYCPGNNLNPIPCNRNITCTASTVDFVARLVDKRWHYSMYNPNSPAARALTANITTEFFAATNNQTNVAGLAFNEFTKGSVIANFTVFFNASPYADIINIQEMIENVGFIGNLQVQPIDVTSVDVPFCPGFVNASSSSPFTITVEWSPVDQTNGEFYLYYVFYRTLDEPWLNVGSENTSLVLKDLIPDAFYFIRVLATAIHGNGIATRPIRISTQAGVPSSKPPSLYHQIIDARTVYLGWNEIPESDVPGRLSGYKITYRKYKENFTITLETIATIPQITLKNLKPNTMYWAEVRGFTRAGVGPNDVVVFKTPPTAPEIAPPNVMVEDRYSVDSIALSWEPIPVDLENGYLIGYKIVYYLTRYRDEEVASREETTILVDRFTYAYRFERLLAYAQYRFEICGYTKEGEGPVETVEGRTCKCPEFIHTNFYSLPPYITPTADSNDVEGLLSSFIDDVASRICIDCLSYTKPTLRFDGTMDGYPSQKSGVIDMISDIGGNVQISLPVHGRFNVEVFTTGHPYIGVVRSQGSAMIVYHEPIKSTDIAELFAVIASGWPLILILTLVSISLSILFWIMERNSPESAISNSIKGVCESFWMTFVTMTTVGYGDVVPTTKKSKVLALFTIFFGVILISFFLGIVTSNLTSTTNQSRSVALYGSKTAALVDTYEYKLALKRNAVIERNFTSVIDIFDAIRNKTVEVGLIDSVVLAEYLDEMSTMNIKVDKIIDTNSGYGLVLSGGLEPIVNDLRSFVLAKQSYIEKIAASRIKRIETKKLITEHELVSKTDMQEILTLLAIVFVCLFLSAGVLWEIVSRVKRSKNQICSQSVHDDFKTLSDFAQSFRASFQVSLDEIDMKQTSELMELCLVKQRYSRAISRMNASEELHPYMQKENPKKARELVKKYKLRERIYLTE